MTDSTAAVDLVRARMTVERLERENAVLRRQVLDARHRANSLARAQKPAAEARSP